MLCNLKIPIPVKETGSDPFSPGKAHAAGQAIFLPLTLVVGVYGMNFDVMPELHLAYGYPAVLIYMVVIVIGLLSIFTNKGWFD